MRAVPHDRRHRRAREGRPGSHAPGQPADDRVELAAEPAGAPGRLDPGPAEDQARHADATEQPEARRPAGAVGIPGEPEVTIGAAENFDRLPLSPRTETQGTIAEPPPAGAPVR